VQIDPSKIGTFEGDLRSGPSNETRFGQKSHDEALAAWIEPSENSQCQRLRDRADFSPEA
jgi:hypothetical protein